VHILVSYLQVDAEGSDGGGGVGLVIIRIVIFTLFNSRISAKVGRLASPNTFSVRQITNSPNASFNPLLLVGSSFLRIVCDAEPYASSPYLTVLRTTMQYILIRFCWSAPHFVWLSPLIIFIFFSALAFAYKMCSFHVILASKINPRMRCWFTCSIRSPFIYNMFIVGLFAVWYLFRLKSIDLVFSVDIWKPVLSAHLVI
jgi:hypothetical protein